MVLGAEEMLALDIPDLKDTALINKSFFLQILKQNHQYDSAASISPEKKFKTTDHL